MQLIKSIKDSVVVIFSQSSTLKQVLLGGLSHLSLGYTKHDIIGGQKQFDIRCLSESSQRMSYVILKGRLERKDKQNQTH